MNVIEKAELRAKFLTSKEQRQLRRIENWKLYNRKPHREVSKQPSDYCLFTSDDILSLVEETVSKIGWNW